MFVNPSTYPLNSDFITFLPQQICDRLAMCGFRGKQVLFFEIPYCPMTGVCAGVIRDYKNKVFYKSLCSTNGVVDGLTDQELRVVVDHEESELSLTVHEVTNSEEISALTTLEEEKKRHIPEFSELEKKYGKDIVTSALTKTADISSKYPVIPRYILPFWLSEFVMQRFDQLSEYATQMPIAMLQNQQVDGFIELIKLVEKKYDGRLPNECLINVYAHAIKVKKEINDNS